nr:ferredoxin family protein [Telmatocola sphagniphila]
MLYIHPSYCDDCEACVPECPVEAIYAEHDVPVRWQGYIQLNADRCKVLEDKGQITIKQEPLNGPHCEEN